ncbi:MAG: ATP-binding cassette domain-containing protein [Tannerellaceae bacterium]
MKKRFTTLMSILLLLLTWQLFAAMMKQPELVPSLPILFNTLLNLLTEVSFYYSLGFTLLRGIGGMLLSLLAASGLALLFARSEFLYELSRPLLALMRSVPVISFILFALIFLVPESIPLIIGFLTMFPLLSENLTQGIRHLRPERAMLGKRFHIGRWNRVTQLFYPQLKPYLYSGLSSAAGFGWRAIIMGEVLSQCTYGIGSRMKQAQTFIEMPQLVAWTLVAIAISYLFDRGIKKLERKQFAIRYMETDDSPNNLCRNQKKEYIPIRMENVRFDYEKTSVLTHFCYTFEAGRIYGITGPSGRGKTTLLNLISGHHRPTDGSVTADRTNGIASVFQEPELLPELTVQENIAFVLSALYTHNTADILALQLIEDMELSGLEDRRPDTLSYGQQQRVAIARALAFPSPILLMDEPFKGLDETTKRLIIERIRNAQQSHKQTLLFTTHSESELQQLAEEVVRL